MYSSCINGGPKTLLRKEFDIPVYVTRWHRKTIPYIKLFSFLIWSKNGISRNTTFKHYCTSSVKQRYHTLNVTILHAALYINNTSVRGATTIFANRYSFESTSNCQSVPQSDEPRHSLEISNLVYDGLTYSRAGRAGEHNEIDDRPAAPSLLFSSQVYVSR